MKIDQASTDTWRFATNQYDYIGEDNANISQTYDGWIDLFGWGTSGYNHGAICYQPWSTSTDNCDYYAYGDEIYNLFDQTGQADWGYNPISNGGNHSNYWRTLTYSEWYYVCNTRNTTTGIRYAKAQVNNINGLILLPDNWSTSTYSLSNTNSSDASFSSNVISLSQWATLENAGAVFLPVTGTRGGSTVYWMNRAHYWSSRINNSNNAIALSFGSRSDGDDYLGFFVDSRNSGHAVRLVRDVVTQTVNLSQGTNWFSTNLDITLDDLKAALVAALPGTSITIKSQNGGQTTWNGRMWVGTLRTMDVSEMYMISVANACEITLEGLVVNPTEHPATIDIGPNWIGFPLGETMTITNAFANFASPGDIVKSDGGGQAAWNGRMWTGQLKNLESGKGYIYESAATESRTFTFPTNAK